MLVMLMKSIGLGIKELDMLFKKGIPQGSNILVYGKAGCGKTILAMEFIYRGATLFKEPGLYVSFEQDQEELIEQCESFNWNVRKLIKQKKMAFLTPSIDEIDREFVSNILAEAKRIKAKRLVIDNLALLTICPLFADNNHKYGLLHNETIKKASTPTQFIFNLIRLLNDAGTTTIYLTTPSENVYDTKDGISEYICDGIINLRSRCLGKSSMRSIEVIKMRRSDIVRGIYSFRITDDGIKVEL
jgi:circadian clock protein KaiC